MRESEIADCMIDETTSLTAVTTRDIANYTGEIAIELSRMSAAKNLTVLAALLRLASVEAKRISETDYLS